MSDPRLDDLWQQVLSNWSDDAAHAAFIELARATGQLGDAAARYREEAKDSGAYREDAPRVEIAKKRLAAIAMLAMIELDANRTPRESTRLQVRVRWASALVLFGFVLFVVVRFVFQ